MLTLTNHLARADFLTQSLDLRYKILLDDFCDLTSKLDMPLVPYRGNYPHRFASLPEPHKEGILAGFGSYYRICSSALENGVNLDDTSLIWWAIKELGMRPHSDLFQRIEKDDVVEIYDTSGIQIFRSFSFFRLLSYSLEEVMTYQWHELYERDEKVTQAMLEAGIQYFAGKLREITEPNFPVHEVREIFGPARKRAVMKHRFLAPIFGPNRELVSLLSAFKILNLKEVRGM